MSDLVWEEPPPMSDSSRPRVNWMEELRPLTERSGEWARVRVWSAKSSAWRAAHMINRRTTPLVVGQWEARVGPVGERWGLWVRYLEEA